VILGVGLFLAAFTALFPLLLGGAILEHGEVEFHLPVFDKVKITSALSFDLGVDFVVIGLILMAFAAFGEDLPSAPGSSDGGSDDPGTPARRRNRTGSR
jgi:multicomponent Na+:H+ antiporter subunit A